MSGAAGGSHRGRRGERGSITLLSMGFVVVVLALVCVVVDASSAYLARRNLAALADGASVSAAQAVDLPAVYAGSGARALPIDAAAATRVVRTYLARDAASGTWTGLSVAQVRCDGTSVTVTLSARQRLPFLGRLARLTGIGGDGSVEITVTSRATSPYLAG